MARHGIQDRQQEINRAAARLAREIAGPGRWVLGDLGPCGDLLDPYGEIQPEALYQDFLDQSRALLEGGADALLVETMSDPAETAIGVRAAKAAGAPVVIATYAFQRSAKGFKTMMGTDVATAVDAAIQAGAQIVGTNCGTSLSLADYLELARELVAAAKGVPVIVQPNAGSPTLVNGVATYNESAETMGQLAVDLIKAGVRIVGGCCGTEPKHIAAMRAAMDRSI
jgi:5-methyltetrahydrofolate--homocysteine methyltransferase